MSARVAPPRLSPRASGARRPARAHRRFVRRAMLTHATAVALWAATAAIAFPYLFTQTAPYGKFVSAGWGPLLNGKGGWLAQEMTSPVAAWFGFTRGVRAFPELARTTASSAADVTYARFLFGLWCAHYANRAVAFPLTRELSPTAAATVFCAVGFNLINGFLVGAEIASMTRAPTDRIVVGGVVFVVGAWINVASDAGLRRRRAERPAGADRYVLPSGGLFDLVACPNYLGECIEWCGFTILANGARSTTAFAFWTFANLFPRALATRAWYRRRFGDAYPRHRRAMIPFIA